MVHDHDPTMPDRSPEPKTAARRPPVAETILATLLDEIVSGRFAPGASLPSEALLSRRFGVSRTALRETMRYLAAHGLVVSRTRAGTTVLPKACWNQFDPTILEAQLRASPDGSIMGELREAVFFLMPRAAALAAERASAAEVAAIERRLAEMPDATGWQTRDAFYAAILDAAGNWVFARMGRLLGTALARRADAVGEQAEGSERTTRWHKALLEAIRLQRPDDARSAMKKLVAGLRAETREAAPK